MYLCFILWTDVWARGGGGAGGVIVHHRLRDFYWHTGFICNVLSLATRVRWMQSQNKWSNFSALIFYLYNVFTIY